MKHVCMECGHVEYRDLAPVSCPNCESHFVAEDAQMIDDDLSEEELELLMERELVEVA